MTDEKLQAIRERAEKATPGPWDVEGPALVVKRVPPEQGRINHIVTDAPYAAGCDRAADADFIAHARTDIPALVAEVERLRTALDREQRDHANCEQFHHDGSMAKTQVIAVLAEQNARMREIVQAVADGEACWYDGVGQHCGFCDQIFDPRVHDRVSHASGCFVPKARALLSEVKE